MKKFDFSLQKVMEVRQTEEKVLQRRLSEAKRSLQTAKEELDALVDRLDLQLLRKTEMHAKPMSSAKYMMLQNYIQNLEEDIDDVRKRIGELETKVDAAREKLLSKTKEKKAIEKLRDSCYEEYRREAKKAEQDFLDEITAQNGKSRAMTS